MDEQQVQETPEQTIAKAQAIINRLSQRLHNTTEELIACQVECDGLRNGIDMLTKQLEEYQADKKEEE